jgi:vacuolar-type H+-ATPase subunit I/STV1
MKKAHVVVLKNDYDKVIKSLQQYGVIMIINKEGGDGNPSLELNEALKQKVDNTIKFASKYEKKKGLFGDYRVVEIEKFKNASNTLTYALLVKPREELQNKVYGNKSDDEVNNYNYDFEFANNKPLDVIEKEWVEFVEREILQKEPTEDKEK